MIPFIFYSVGMLFLSISLHEVGHLIALRKYGVNANISWFCHSWRKFGFRVGLPKDYVKLSRVAKYDVYFLGVFLGLVPLIIIAWTFNVWWNLLIVMYLVGCSKDLKNLWKCWK